MHYVLFKTRAGVLYNEHICRLGESGIGRTEGGWKFPELTERSEVGSGNFQPPEVVQSRTHRTCNYVWFLSHAISVKSTEEFTHFSI
jgi:hypothetical protein